MCQESYQWHVTKRFIIPDVSNQRLKMQCYSGYMNITKILLYFTRLFYKPAINLILI